ncbi:MAG TPA: biopolymer transporter ExbD [Ignavibacteria bacterium]
MSGTDFDTPDAGGGRGKQHKKVKAAGVRIDMTPMVDVIMLLLTFFMLTTTLSKPQVMKINLPKGEEKDKLKVDMGTVLFIRVSEKGNIYFFKGKSDGSEQAAEKVDIKDLKVKLETLSAINKQNQLDLLVLLKFDRKMKYKVMVDILDQINLANIDKKYAFLKMEEEDLKKVNEAGG